VSGHVRLRDVEQDDLLIFYHHQLDREASRMAAFPSRDRDSFMAHWNRILGEETVIARTVLVDGRVAGNVVSFEREGHREVGYWIGKRYWGRGVATEALARFLELVPSRPLYAHVARHNVASVRVLEKCGFAIVGKDEDFSDVPGVRIEGVVLELGQ
jgi:RimJ/RimL family protein N-acetyltransferase